MGSDYSILYETTLVEGLHDHDDVVGHDTYLDVLERDWLAHEYEQTISPEMDCE